MEELFQRAAAMMFIISEVHPFDDGNGGLARAFMNAELVSGGQRRIVIPTVFRDDYLTGLRVLTRDKGTRIRSSRRAPVRLTRRVSV